MAIRDEEVMALNALLGLTGQLLGHHASVKAIKTDAKIKQDELRFKIKKQQQNNALEIEKFAMQLALKDIEQLDRKLEQAENSFYETTHKRYKYADEDLTANGTKLVMGVKANNESKIYQMRLSADQKVEQRKNRLKAIKREMDNIDPALDFIKQNYSSSVAGDKKQYTQEDYTGTVTLMEEALGIDEPNEYLTEAINMNAPGAQGLIQLNNELSKLDKSDKRYDFAVGTASASAQASAERHITSMATSFAPAENKDTSPKMDELTEKVTAARKEGTLLYGKSIGSDEMEIAIKNDIITAVSGGMVGLEAMISQNPWVEEAIKDLFPMQWIEYVDKKKRWKGIATGAVNKPSQNSNTNIDTIDSTTSAGKALGYFN